MNGRIYRYSRILHALSGEPLDAAEVAELIGAATIATRVTMGRMGSLRLIHEVVPPSRFGLAKWQIGPGPASSRKRVLKPGKAGVAVIHFAALIRAMCSPTSTAELARTIGSSQNTVRSQVAAMRKANVAYRAEWHRDHEYGEWAAHWRFGIDKKDAPRPRAKTEQELRAVYKANRRRREATVALVRALAANASIFTRAACFACLATGEDFGCVLHEA